MFAHIAWRFARQARLRNLYKFASTFCMGGIKSLRKFEQSRNSGAVFPPFIFISVTDRCNLSCKGCWVGSSSAREMTFEQLDRILCEAKLHGNRFFGILGGEPLLCEWLFEVFRRHRDCYFQLFTNGTLINETVLGELASLDNVTPLVSIEGLEQESDSRRGGSGVFFSATEAVRRLAERGIITGVATSVCKTSFDDVVSSAFIERMVSLGALYVWYYIYRPVGLRPCPDLALSENEIYRLREFLVRERSRQPVALIDAYWDADGHALCPAATGISHHINPAGQVEPCPPVQFSGSSAHSGLADSFNCRFLKEFRTQIPARTRGCILMDDPGFLHKMVNEESVADSSGRGTALAELGLMQPCPGHNMAEPVPEWSWFYRFAKKRWFFGFGAYG